MSDKQTEKYSGSIPAPEIQTSPVDENDGVAVEVSMGGKTPGKHKTVKEAAKKLKQDDMAKTVKSFKKTMENEGAVRAEVSLQPGHYTGDFQQAPIKPGDTSNPIQFSQVDCIKSTVTATNGMAAIQVPIVRGDVREWTKEGVVSVDLTQAKEAMKKPAKDEEVEIDLSQDWEAATVTRRTLIRDSDTTKKVMMIPGNVKAAPNISGVIRSREGIQGTRVVLNAEQLRRAADYACKYGDGTIMLDVIDHEHSVYMEVPVDECGVAKIIISQASVRDVSAPYQNAVRITER